MWLILSQMCPTEASFLWFESFSKVNEFSVLYRKNPDTTLFVTSENFCREDFFWCFLLNTATPGLLNVTHSCVKMIPLSVWSCLFFLHQHDSHIYIYLNVYKPVHFLELNYSELMSLSLIHLSLSLTMLRICFHLHFKYHIFECNEFSQKFLNEGNNFVWSLTHSLHAL